MSMHSRSTRRAAPMLDSTTRVSEPSERTTGNLGKAARLSGSSCVATSVISSDDRGVQVAPPCSLPSPAELRIRSIKHCTAKIGPAASSALRLNTSVGGGRYASARSSAAAIELLSALPLWRSCQSENSCQSVVIRLTAPTVKVFKNCRYSSEAAGAVAAAAATAAPPAPPLPLLAPTYSGAVTC